MSGTTIGTTTTTGTGGSYFFSNVAPGSYYVVFSPPTGFTFSPQDQGGNDTLDSDANSLGRTADFTVAAGQVKMDVDAGVRPPT